MTIRRFPSAPVLGATAAMPPRVGKYEILERIAVGGMAEIYLARVSGISGFEKLVVVKRILPQLAVRPEFVQMFLDEARIAASLEHSNIVHVFDVGAEEGQYYFAMEFLHGEDVSTFMQALSVAGRELPLEAALAIVTGMLAGLHFAHEQKGRDGAPLRIVHRDVSPQNVLVTFDGGVKLLDFGIAKASRRLSATRHGLLKGKVQYMSPEQCRGEPVDRRSDVFSAAIILWELTTGRRLFAGPAEFAIMKRVVETDAPPPSSVRPGYSPALERIVLRGLRRERRERYQTAQEMQVELEELARAGRLAVSAIALARLMRELFGEQLRAWDALRQGSGSIDAFRGTAMLRRETLSEIEAREGDEGSLAGEDPDDLFAATDPAVDADGRRLPVAGGERPTAPLTARAGPVTAVTDPVLSAAAAPATSADVPVPAPPAEPAPAAPRRRGVARWLVAGGVVAALAVALVAAFARSPRPAASPPAPVAGALTDAAPVPTPASPVAAAPAASQPAGDVASAPREAVPPPRAGTPPRVRVRGPAPEPRRGRATEAKAPRGARKPLPPGVNLDSPLPP